MELLEVKGLRKQYPGFLLKDVSFSLEPGYIMGFIGRNGAGKTTTMKSMLGLIAADAGSVKIGGMDFFANQRECKQNIGFVMGEFNCYLGYKLKTITKVTKRFYDDWNEEAYRGCLSRFKLDENKRVKELSAGMRVKYALALALSHNAQLLILDEPTSGLDPISRDDLLDVFRGIVEDGTRSILFSTHIISDLEKCADLITYIKNGELYASEERETFRSKYLLVSGGEAQLEALRGSLLGVKKNAFGFTGLIEAAKAAELPSDIRTAPADLESIMIYIEQEEKAV